MRATRVLSCMLMPLPHVASILSLSNKPSWLSVLKTVKKAGCRIRVEVIDNRLLLRTGRRASVKYNYQLLTIRGITNSILIKLI